VRYQLRIYTIRPGEMDAWISEWTAQIVRLRRTHGFEVAGAWTIAASNRFVWVLSYSGSKSWEHADADYYASAERAALDPDPARHIIRTEQWLMSGVTPT
jgi:hypothetical protein